ncbi:hypothetical protein KY342_03660 [Candidatus Woesearchaeota archaeon]|nr:hypothetical protein [Candidatus Woesearchaeota archaeon]
MSELYNTIQQYLANVPAYVYIGITASVVAGYLVAKIGPKIERLIRDRRSADVRRVELATGRKLVKEIKRNPGITLGEAVHEIWEDLDVALVGAPREHAEKRISVVNEAMDRIGINK